MTSKLNIATLFFVLIIVSMLGAKSASAQVSCKEGDPVPGQPSTSNHFYNGTSCSYSGFNQNKKCIAASGSKYWVFYCSNGCEVQYDEFGDKAPFSCRRDDPGAESVIRKIFGQIEPPQAIQNFGFGEAGINKFLSNLVTLIFSLAAVVLIFMILWGAFDWITSEGDKEKLERARNKLINAIIGILLFAAAFAIIRVLGQFTGFTFFTGQ